MDGMDAKKKLVEKAGETFKETGTDYFGKCLTALGLESEIFILFFPFSIEVGVEKRYKRVAVSLHSNMIA